MEFIIPIAILILSVILHELAHGYVALWQGDPTARLAGRLTLNPVSHIDPVGSVLLPGLLALSGSGIVFGWAKPVPYNPYNLRNQRWGEALVAGAGPLTNLLIAVIIGLIIRFFGGQLSQPVEALLFVTAYINIILALFNLIPIPPIDGSKVLSSILPLSMRMRLSSYEMFASQFSFIAIVGFMLVFFFVLQGPFFALVRSIFGLITGLAL